MAKFKAVKEQSEEELAKGGMYKGYDIEWLRGEPNHPDFGFVAEFDEKYGKKEAVEEE